MTPISYKAWAHPSPRAIVLMVHGLGGNSSWWECAGNFFAEKGLSSYAIDLRHLGSFKDFFTAIQKLREVIKKGDLELKIFAIGESMGALLILSMALKDKELFNGLALISPAFKSKFPLKIRDYLNIFLPLFYRPGTRHTLPVTPNMCTRDPKNLKMIERTYDKDVMQTSRALFDIFITQLYMRMLKMKVAVPCLFLIAGDDKLVYSEASKSVFDRLKAADKKLIEYPGMYHSLSIDTGKEKVFQDILSWIDGRVSA